MPLPTEKRKAVKPFIIMVATTMKNPHDGNFCMDGLVFPDRTPHTGILEYKNVYRPVRVVSYDQETGSNWFYIITWILMI